MTKSPNNSSQTDAHGVDKPHLAREHLPIPDVQHVGLTTYDAKDPNTSYPPIKELRPPAGAPNVLIVLLDDVGFGASTTFGGPCATPVADRMAEEGIRLDRFHTTALCSPTRQAMLTGRNHHSVGMGAITEMATSAPGNSSIRPKEKAPVAETLKLNGYSTAQFGKCHEVPVWEVSPVGPFSQWPTGSGFEYFYGFVGGEANQYYPGLYEGTTPVEPSSTPEQGYTLTQDLADHAITWVRQQKALAPDKPFFMYFAPGATHAPHHVPQEWSDKYRGKFDEGWDKLREQIFARQKELGVIPADAELTARHEEIPAWDDMPAELKPVLARQMEIYAGFLEQTDYEVGRVLDAIDSLGALDDTLVFYIIGDNGASAEGTPVGCFNEMTTLNGMPGIETTEFLMSKIDDFGTPEAYNHYAVGWAHALCTPYQWTKQVASHWGGTRNGTIVRWGNGLGDGGGIRHQFHHVIDIVPTILEAAGIPAPQSVNGITQAPLEGVSMLGSLRSADAPETHDVQYFEIMGNRGIYFQGWTAVTKHRTPWKMAAPLPFDEDVWELYGPGDWTQSRDLSKEQPEQLAYLQRLWLIEATKYGVVPLDDRTVERIIPELSGRPSLIKGTSQLMFSGMRLAEAAVISVKNRSHAVTAEIDVPDGGANGVIVTQGGLAGGWALYVHEKKLTYCYNFFGIDYYVTSAEKEIPAGRHQVRMEFAYDGGGLAQGGDITLFYDGEPVGTGRVDRTQPVGFSADEACDVGRDTGSSPSPDYRPGTSAFTGTIAWVEIDTGDDDHDHLVTAEDRLRIAMGKQ
ncbi:MAG TPA: arylsulfatase [Gordonia sp. (in: high G+C Gram-positive bacteria)]|uniref:arylsulfatase n=1 Tax=unclassified Gordonia (in: high G+C Gram-positive bacteria) TaxID=2657482 RepID=UPI000FA243B2|nr:MULTISPECIES: arylsulfatase [unclassified Gordonia (in: high G+C Gram-positive bacteria)]RUP37264.1 MAG: arylsulfatase [Gordonia sp. (in: high G+C Gram-positive bacteria)]HNP57548.1 arylsulfatase [Gordonia sp. (in: high G+C Gram-positive bacteria)]HRC51067.1 arylsulfatase [Gordonia sp. (in: high G+C Gram-positive bacteria)]